MGMCSRLSVWNILHRHYFDHSIQEDQHKWHLSTNEASHEDLLPNTSIQGHYNPSLQSMQAILKKRASQEKNKKLSTPDLRQTSQGQAAKWRTNHSSKHTGTDWGSHVGSTTENYCVYISIKRLPHTACLPVSQAWHWRVVASFSQQGGDTDCITEALVLSGWIQVILHNVQQSSDNLEVCIVEGGRGQWCVFHCFCWVILPCTALLPFPLPPPPHLSHFSLYFLFFFHSKLPTGMFDF